MLKPFLANVISQFPLTEEHLSVLDLLGSNDREFEDVRNLPRLSVSLSAMQWRRGPG